MNPDLKEIIQENEIAMQNYESLSESEKKKINSYIDSAKSEDKKALRIGQTIEKLMEL